MFLTPVIYPVTIVSKQWQWLLTFNPITGIIEGFRASVLSHKPMPLELLSVSTIVIVCILISGFFFFQKMEERFVDDL
jgi:lipopolysaccharide transport system permease protein